MTITSHKITCKLPRYLGGVDDGDIEYFKVDVVFNFRPEWKADRDDPGAPAEMNVLQVILHQGESIGDVLTRQEVKDIAQEWLDRDGYDAACALALEERSERAA